MKLSLLLSLGVLCTLVRGKKDSDELNHRLRHRHRHRHRLRHVYEESLDSPSLVDVLEIYRDENSLTSPLDTEGELYEQRSQCNMESSLTDSVKRDKNLEYCKGKNSLVLKVLASIERRVNFHFNHLDKFNKMYASLIGNAVLLSQLNHILKENASIPPVLRKRVQILQSRMVELSPKLLKQVLHGIEDELVVKEFTLIANASIWEGASSGDPTWVKKLELELGDEYSGIEKDPLWKTINVECFTALILGCNIPFICEKLYLGPPLAQYALTHQVMYRQLGNQFCGENANWLKFAKNNENSLDELCKKSYLEAKFIADNGFHSYMLDLFAEHVGGCGLVGYENFIREDWTQKILSLEVPSVGCAPNVYQRTIEVKSGDAVSTSDPVMVVKSADNSEPIECLIHLGSESLLALAVSLRHLLIKC